MIHFDLSSTLTAFSRNTVGSKVLSLSDFLRLTEEALDKHDKSSDRAPGQHFVMLPASACELVSAGVGKRTENSDDYVLREHRERVSAYLKRERAAKAESVAVVIYTRAAYLADPDVKKFPERIGEIEKGNCTHVIVAVLAFAGPKAPLTPYRFVHNLAGGNNEALAWTADEIREKAAEIKAYDDEWCVVAD